MKKTLTRIAMAALFALPLGFALQANAAPLPAWDVTGDYVVNFNYLGTDYAHDMSLTQDASGNLTGNGGNPAGGVHVYDWVIDSGTASGSAVDFWAHYTAAADASGTVMHVIGTVASSGAMTGTWTDNYQGGSRSGTWATASGTAVTLGTLNAEDFGVVNYDTGLGILKGYTAGFGLTDTTFASATSVVVKLYAAGDVLLQTNTAIIPKFNADITGTQFSSPFDVSGTFDYATDGYWTNVRETQYGQSVPATKVVATVTLANGNVVTATNTNLTGDPTTIYPTTPVNTAPVLSGVPTATTTIPELSPYSFDANATDSDVPAQTLTFSLVSAPAGASIDSSTGVFTWTPTEAQGPGTYMFSVMVSDGSLTDTQPVVISVTEVPDPVTHPTDKDRCKGNGWKTFTNPSFKNQGQCVSSVANGK
jgi:hypothetical protein